MPLPSRQLRGEGRAGGAYFRVAGILRLARAGGVSVTDVEFVETVLRDLEKLDAACLDFLAADSANPRKLEAVVHKGRCIDASKAELLTHDLLQLDKLAMQVLQSSPGEWAIRFREDVTGAGSGHIERLHRLVRRRHRSLLNLAKLLRGRESGNAEKKSTKTNSTVTEPSADAIACYRLFIATGKPQRELAEMMSHERKRPIDQPRVSRWCEQVRAWLKAGNVLPDLTADSGANPKTVPMDPAKIDQGDGRKQATRPRRSGDPDRDDELQKVIAEQQADDD